LKNKGLELLSELLEDFALREGIINPTFKDLLQDEEVECFAGYADEGVRLVENVNLTHCVSEDGMILTREHLLDYA